jgi:RNA polymerase sigma-32 factor
MFKNYIFSMTKKLNQNTENKLDLIKNNTSKSADGFAKYLNEIQKFPLLTPEQEYEYAVRFIEQNDSEAGKMLIQSHLRLVVKVANKFKNYGLPTADLVAEGNMGLIQALKKFEPKKGFRFSTYSMWWIRAFIQDYVLRSWSLVKIGTTSAQKKLFFNLGKIKKRLGVQSNEFGLSQEKIKRIADTLNVSSQEVVDMNSRLTQSDSSLNHKIGEDDDSIESLDLLVDNRPNQEQISIENQQRNQQRNLFKKAFEKLNLREQEIIFKRQISEDSQTLEELSQHYKVSRERIRQIEEVALKKLKKTISELIK